MRTREEIEAVITGICGMIEVAKSEIEEWESEINSAYEKKAELEAELSSLDESEGENE